MAQLISPDATPYNRVLSPALRLNPPNTDPDLYAAALGYFSSIPWCAELLTSDTVPFIPGCRNPLSDRHDQLFGRTLATDRALRHMLCFFTPDDDSHTHDPQRPITRISTFFALGDGVSGYPSILHGGMTMAMVDEAMGVTTELNMALRKDGVGFAGNSVTAALEISFVRPIPTEGVVCATSWMDNQEGRKRKVRCEVVDGEGTVLARCSSTWVALKPKV